MSIFYLLLTIVIGIQGIHLPGIQSKAYEYGEKINVYMNEMTSQTNQIPYDHYMLEFCQPLEGIENKYENIGSLLMGTKTQNSAYNLYMDISEMCSEVCQQDLDDYDVNNFKWFIDHNYRINIQVDGLPIIDETRNGIQIGVPIGFVIDEEYTIYNHITFEIEIYTEQQISYINKVEAIPKSIIGNKRNDDTYVAACMDQESKDDDYLYQLTQPLEKGKIIFTYDTIYLNSTTKSDRWEIYKKLGQEDAQWLSLSLTFAITILLAGIVALFLRLIIKRDILKFERLPNNVDENNFDEMGWKQVSRDVFRPPSQPLLISVFLGTGIQLIVLIIATLFLACIGFVYQAHSGNLATLIVIIYVFTGSLNGYYTAKYYKYFKGEYWLLCTLLSNLAFPAMGLIIYMIQHIFLFFEESSSSFSFKAAITFLALQIGIQTPLNLIGSFIGYKVESTKNPCKYYAIAQYIPPQPFYLDMFYSCVIGGLICFVSVGIELGYIMTLIWKHSYYEFFVSLFLSLILLFIICAEVSIILTYLSLIKQNHRWHWKAFFVPFSSGIYLFVYSVQYYLATLQLTRLSAILYYFGTMYLASLTLGIVCGTIGFLSSYVFVKKIYSMVKID